MELKKRFEAVNQFKYLQSPLFPTFLEEIRVEKHGSCLLYNTNDRIKHTLKDVIPVIKADKDKRWLTHVISQVITGIYELHSRGYIHSAILSERLEHALYVKSKKQIKLNVIFDNAMPPEVAANDLMSGYPYDSWMLGALIYECFTGHLPYEVARTGKSAAHIEALKFTKLTLTTAYHNKLNFCPQIAGPLDKLSMNEMPLLSLVDGLMAPSPGERPSIMELSMVASNQWIKYRRGDRHNKIPV
ncbi:hypothetical protein BDF22DRAFT_651878 [Syncephalis plumigaleata]|nr:hypothetical protein BDF22DRAFT_651878 [Syncephalis plumigaleata]